MDAVRCSRLRARRHVAPADRGANRRCGRAPGQARKVQVFEAAAKLSPGSLRQRTPTSIAATTWQRCASCRRRASSPSVWACAGPSSGVDHLVTDHRRVWAAVFREGLFELGQEEPEQLEVATDAVAAQGLVASL